MTATSQTSEHPATGRRARTATATPTTPGLLVARDLAIAAWLDRLAGASVDQIRRRFSLGRTQAYRRLQVLADYGLITRRHLTTTLPPVYVVPSRSLRLASVAHAFWVTELVVSLELRGSQVVTELELRRERARQPSLSVDAGLSDPQAETIRGCDRVPDAVEVLAGGGLCAWEIEISSKGRSRRGRVLAALAVSDYERVHWIAPDPQLAALLDREINQRGLDAFMEVTDAITQATV